MAYKKYIRRNGKLYGPYLYESKRVDGKVVSEYHGSKEITKRKFELFKSKKLLPVFLTFLLLSILIFLLFTFSNKSNLSGKAIFEIDSSYNTGKPLQGVLKFSLDEGEFIPASSKIVFDNSGKAYEFPINSLIDESPSEGNYYVSQADIEGSGEGYGIEGEKEIYPELSFILQIYKETTEEETDVNVEEITNEEISEEEIINSAPITGESVRESRRVFGSLFGITGMVTMELQEEIEASVSKENPFIYELKEGERAELKHKSVYLGEEELEDNAVTLEVEGNLLTVTTDYSITEKGYGEDYLGDKQKTFSIDLEELNLVLEEGELNIRLVYESNEIISLSTSLENNEKTSEELIEEEEEITPEEEIEDINSENETVEEIIDSSIWDISNFLTEEEKEILLENFGEVQLKNVKSEMFNDRIIRVYEIGEYSIEYSYDSSLNEDVLEVQMERDRIKFLKDIASALSKEEISSEPITEFQENYTF